ncbi:UNVERIFIED_CONTAM: hypothetical protein Scaly_0578300 [Sesamum calycinum]|uniref:2-oxoglutarate (2OG) and Fe(II)-dependent oxygenase superfamily protein n=1 Tax=Sesamum calycinum TaxID=2727403 RepID=A0AAW2RRR6_9LAMI
MSLQIGTAISLISTSSVILFLRHPPVPGYPLLRQHLLHLAPRLASLPEEVKRELEDPNSRYNIGWSHGKEKLESGKLDLLKGSFYANPILDIPTTELSLVKRYPSYCGPNMWPRRALPELEPAFKALGKLILDVGLLLAHHCDRYGKFFFEDLVFIELHDIFKWSHNSTSAEDDETVSSWCGWHTDHGSLTGLTCGMFTRDAVELPCPDSAAGLYVVYGEDEIAYQIGETTEILSRGQLCATPHCVRARICTVSEYDGQLNAGLHSPLCQETIIILEMQNMQDVAVIVLRLFLAPKGEAAFGVERSTFALFMQPDCRIYANLELSQIPASEMLETLLPTACRDEKLIFPELKNIHEFSTPNGSISFGDYTEKVLDKYYDLEA